MARSMRQPRSIRFHLAAVFLVFFVLVVVLGLFSIWRLCNFNRLSADVAELWLPTTRVLGDLNNFTSDFRAVEGQQPVVVGRPRRLRRPKRRWRSSIARSPTPSAASSGSAIDAAETISTTASRSAGPTIAPSSTRCWCCRAPTARPKRWQIYTGASRDGLQRGKRHARPADRPGGRQRASRQRRVSPSPIGRRSGSSSSPW